MMEKEEIQRAKGERNGKRGGDERGEREEWIRLLRMKEGKRVLLEQDKRMKEEGKKRKKGGRGEEKR